MPEALKVINFAKNNIDKKNQKIKEKRQNSNFQFSISKLFLLVSFVLTLSLVVLYIFRIELVIQYRTEFSLTILSSISLVFFTLGAMHNTEKSYKLELVGNKKTPSFGSNISINDSIIPYFKISTDGKFICKNNSLSSLLNIESSKSLNLFNDFIKNEKIEKHILLKLENKGILENYRLQLQTPNGSEIYVSMSSKYNPTTKTIEGALSDITSQHLKEISIAQELERVKTELLIVKNNQTNLLFDEEKTSKFIHDLRTPLNSIFGFLSLIENHHYETEEELLEFTKNTKLSGQQILQIIDNKFRTHKIQREAIEEENLFNNVIKDEVELKEEENNQIIEFPKNNFDNKLNSGQNLLLVEDNPMNQQIETKLLEKVGYNVYAVKSGEEAIEQVKTKKFDLVLMDIELPGISGLEATIQIRKLDQSLKNIPIIAATAKSSMKDREKCLAVGMNDYISKPINITFMKMTIDQWIKKEAI